MPTYQRNTSRSLSSSENRSSRERGSRKAGGLVQRATSVVLLIITVVVCLLSLGGPSGLLELRALENDVLQLKEKNQTLDREILDLNNRIYGVRQNDFVLEKTAREELGFAKPGEVVYVFPDEASDVNSARQKPLQQNALNSPLSDSRSPSSCSNLSPTSSGCEAVLEPQINTTAPIQGSQRAESTFGKR